MHAARSFCTRPRVAKFFLLLPVCARLRLQTVVSWELLCFVNTDGINMCRGFLIVTSCTQYCFRRKGNMRLHRKPLNESSEKLWRTAEVSSIVYDFLYRCMRTKCNNQLGLPKVTSDFRLALKLVLSLSSPARRPRRGEPSVKREAERPLSPTRRSLGESRLTQNMWLFTVLNYSTVSEKILCLIKFDVSDLVKFV